MNKIPIEEVTPDKATSPIKTALIQAQAEVPAPFSIKSHGGSIGQQQETDEASLCAGAFAVVVVAVVAAVAIVAAKQRSGIDLERANKRGGLIWNSGW